MTPLIWNSILALFCALAVGACSTSTLNRPPVSSTEVLPSERKHANNDAESPLQQLDNAKTNPVEHNTAARAYLDKAKSHTIEEQPAFLLRAAELFFAANNPRDAMAALDKIQVSSLSSQEQAQYTLLQAKRFSLSQRHTDALAQLENVAPADLSTNQYRAEYYAIKAQSEFSTGNKDRAMIALLERENYLERDAIGNNQQRLWAIVDLSTNAELTRMRQTTTNQALADWLDLATLANHARSIETSPSPAPLTPLPPRESLSEVPSIWTENSPKKVALLLPISSNFGSAATAFEAGFRQASREHRGTSSPSVMTYDLGNTTTALNIVDQASRDGADFIVGPLGKAAAQSVLDILNPSVPIMALGGVIRSPSPLISVFTLSPEQEMAAIARHAKQRGFNNAAILFPDSPWGERHRDAFKHVWANMNGNTVREQVYQANSYDHSATIKTLLAINASNNRHSQLSATLGFKPEFTPVRRGDIDFLVLVARSNTARIIKPQLSFYQAHDLPVYSPSAVYTGVADPANDADLDGLTFPEMPWLLSDTNNHNANHSRLFAFGYDAYQLIPILTQLRLSDGLSYQGLSGQLVADSNGQIIRHPAFATFKNGIPELDDKHSRYQVATPTTDNNTTVIDRSNRYDPQTWNTGTNRRR